MPERVPPPRLRYAAVSRAFLLAGLAALDRVQAAGVLRRLARAHPTSVLAMHDVPLALEHTDRILVLEAGRLVLDAPARALPAAELMRFYA